MSVNAECISCGIPSWVMYPVLWPTSYRTSEGISGNLESFPALRHFSGCFPFFFGVAFIGAMDLGPRAATESEPSSFPAIVVLPITASRNVLLNSPTRFRTPLRWNHGGGGGGVQRSTVCEQCAPI